MELNLKDTVALKEETRQETVAKEVRHTLHMASCLISFLEASSRLENSGRPWAPLEKENRSLPSLGHPDWPARLVAHIAWDLPHTPYPDLTGPTGSLLSILVLRLHLPTKEVLRWDAPQRENGTKPQEVCSKCSGGVLDLSLLK